MEINERLNMVSTFEKMTTNPETVNALCEGIDGNMKRFDTVEELMKDLEDEDDKPKQ